MTTAGLGVLLVVSLSGLSGQPPGTAALADVQLRVFTHGAVDAPTLELARSEPGLATLELGHLVGLAIAHEVGHAFGLPHARSGVMKARLATDDLLALRASRLAFTSETRRGSCRAIRLVRHLGPTVADCTGAFA